MTDAGACYPAGVPKETDKLRQALDCYNESDYVRALILLETLDFERLDSDLIVEAHYLWGQVLVKKHDLLEAAHRFQTCARQNPKFFAALDAWGNVLASMGDARGAIDKYKRALAVAAPKQSGHILYNYGQVLMDHGDTLLALEKFRACFKHGVRASDAAYSAGLCFLNRKRPRGARKWMQIAVEQDPASMRNLVGLGNAHSLARNLGGAEECFEAALRLEPGNTDAHYNWAVALTMGGKYVQAIRRCKTGLRTNPESFELMAQHVYCLRKMGAYDAALAAAKRMHEALVLADSSRKPEFEDLHRANVAACLRSVGRNRESRSGLLEFLQESPGRCRHSLTELRYQDTRALKRAHRYELTARVRRTRAGFDPDGSPPSYTRTYWVIAASERKAREIVAELEPQDATLSFEPGLRGARLSDVDQGVLERSSAVPG